MLYIWLATFDHLLLLYQLVRALSVISCQVALWSDKIQAAIKIIFIPDIHANISEDNMDFLYVTWFAKTRNNPTFSPIKLQS